MTILTLWAAANTAEAGAGFDEIDASVLEALPPEIRAEVMAEEQRRREQELKSAQAPPAAGAMNATSGDMDNATFIASLDPMLREEVEAEMAKGKIERVKRNADSGGKQPVEAKGTHCQVHKHSGMGCAVVSLEAAQHREAIMNYAEKTYGWSPLGKLEMDIADVKVQLKRHKDKSTGREAQMIRDRAFMRIAREGPPPQQAPARPPAPRPRPAGEDFMAQLGMALGGTRNRQAGEDFVTQLGMALGTRNRQAPVVVTTTTTGTNSPRLSSFDKADRALLERLVDYDEETCQESE
eukprot:g20124.t1